MKLFGKRNKESRLGVLGGVLFGDSAETKEESEIETPESATQTEQTASAPCAPAAGNEHLGGRRPSYEDLLKENGALRREISELKSRISYARSVLLADIEVPQSHTAGPVASAQMSQAPGMSIAAGGVGGEVAMPPAAPLFDAGSEAGQSSPAWETKDAMPPAESAPASDDSGVTDDIVEVANTDDGDELPARMGTPTPQESAVGDGGSGSDELRAMLADLKADIESIREETAHHSADAQSPSSDLRAMLEELKADIAAIRSEATMHTAPAVAPSPDLREMLADLKADIAAIREEAAARPEVTPPPSADLRAMLAELKADIASIRSEPSPSVPGEGDDLRAMLARLRADIDSLRETRERAFSSMSPQENGVHRLLAELQEGVADIAVSDGTVAEASDDSAEVGRKPLFGGGGSATSDTAAASVATPSADDDAAEPAPATSTSEDDSADNLSSRIEALLAELHNELNQAVDGRTAHTRQGASEDSGSEGEDGRRQGEDTVTEVVGASDQGNETETPHDDDAEMVSMDGDTNGVEVLDDDGAPRRAALH